MNSYQRIKNMSYLETTHNVYKEAALTPDVGLCCTTNPIWELPGLKIPRIMQEMNYGCGSTVHARDLNQQSKNAICWCWWRNGITAICVFQQK